MGIKLTLFNDIKARLEAKVPELLTIRKWNNQFNNESREYAFKFPAAFISFSEMQWQPPKNTTALVNQLQAQQEGVFVVSIYLGFDKLEDETESWPDIEPIIHKVWSYLEEWTGTPAEYGKLIRVSEVEDNNHDNVIVWVINFEFRVAECATVGDMVAAPDPLTLTIDTDLIIDANTVNDIRTDADFPS